MPIIKPEFWSSFDVVKKLRFMTKIKKVGHAGTLDPFATGLLIIGFGNHTKLLDQYKSLKKEYIVTARLGLRTNTQDITGEVINELTVDNNLIISDIQKALKSFIGPIEQIPPMFSAKSINGKRLYKYARNGQEIERKAVKVIVDNIDLIHYQLPNLTLKITCSAGTYIRTIIDDLGQKLGCGATAVSLTRTKIGDFSAENAYSIEKFEDEWTSLAV